MHQTPSRSRSLFFKLNSKEMSSFQKKSPQNDGDSSDDELPPPLNEEEEVKAAEPQEDTTLANSDVVTKHQEAAKITNGALALVTSLCVNGARIIDICAAGDKFITDKCALIYNKKKDGKAIDKGIAFPVCVSVNECVCHCSPLASDDSYAPLKDGDMVKIDLGTHIDGYIALSAHTLVVGHVPNPSAPITGPRANVIHAAWTAANVAAKLIRPGNTNAQVTEAIKKITEAYGVKAIVGGIIHQMKRYVIEVTTKQAILRDDIPEHKVDACTFEPFEVYALDIAMSSGKGMPRDMSARTTVYRRKVDVKYGLRNKASRAFFNDVNKVAPTMPFSLRMFSDEKSAKLGVRECVSHDLLAPYPVVYEHDGDVVAHVKFTVLLLASGNSIITGLPVPEGFACPDVTLPEDIQTILAQEDKKAAKKKAAKAAAAGGAGK